MAVLLSYLTSLPLKAIYGFITFIAYYIWRHMSRQQLMLDQKSQEVTAVGELNVKMLNERATLLEGMEHQKGRLANLCLALTLAEGSPGPLELGQELLSIIQQEVGAEYASLTLVEPNGTLGKRVDRFQGIKPFQVSAHRGGLAESILSTGRTQYVADTDDTRANPSLAVGGIRSYIGIAIRAEEQLVGILFLHSTKPDAFRGERSFLESLASICALPLQRARLNSYIETAKHELEATFDAIPNGVVLIDEERRVLRANQAFAQRVGWQVEKVVGVTVCKLIHGQDDPFHRCPLDKSLSSAQPDVIVFREPHLGNTLLNVRTYPAPAPQGRPRRFVQLFSFSE